jgi:hypothetical protein
MSVLTPTAGIDPRTALATSLHAAPGVYAVLAGSGMSSEAGIPTGWQVMQDLIRRVAVCEGLDEAGLHEEPAAWWAERVGSEPRYDQLIRGLASTDAARQAILQQYFDPPPEVGGPIPATDGHQALAALCATGRIRVILTTNFDRLLERALEEAGVAPQVISTPEELSGMKPLAHGRATVVKLHGDYAGPMLNTPEELAQYPKPLCDLLMRVFDEYGLIVVGWSAEYDKALAAAISGTLGRRYPTYWTLFDDEPSEPARRLIDRREATVVKTTGASEFFVDIAQRIARLDRRARRKGQPAPLRTYSYMPDQSSAPPGWTVLPLLQLRAAAAIGPAPLEECGVVGPEQREALLVALEEAALTDRLRELDGAPGASATAPDGSGASNEFVDHWLPTPGGYQSTDQASYRLGGDGSFGVSALANTSLAGFAIGASVLFTIDIALSLAAPIALTQAAFLWRDGLVITTSLLPEAIETILPTETEVLQAEVHLLAARMDGQGRSRPNELAQHLDLSALGTPTRQVGPSMGSAMRLSGSLPEHEAAEFVLTAIGQMALANGYLDPRDGIAELRRSLKLDSTAGA